MPPSRNDLYFFSPSRIAKSIDIGDQHENLPPVDRSKGIMFSWGMPYSKAPSTFDVIA